MRELAAVVAASAVLLGVALPSRLRLVDRVAAYLQPVRRARVEDEPSPLPAAGAGLSWTRHELAIRRVAAGLIGAFVGLLAAQGDLFIAGSGRSAPALALIGAAAGVLILRVWLTQRTERRGRQLLHELPAVADLLALRLLAGESVGLALEHVAMATRGVAASEIGDVLERHASGVGLTEALQTQTRRTAIEEAARLYGFLATAHQSGGRLADALLDLSSEYRALSERNLTAEGGRRAIATYGPIIALMVPVALLFLMYPTLAGLGEISAAP